MNPAPRSSVILLEPTTAPGRLMLPLPRNALLPEGGPTVEPRVGSPRLSDTPDQIVRFRWWYGHQLTFCLWRMLSDVLRSILRSDTACPASVREAATLIEACTVMLLYAGSCSPEAYSRTLRPEMINADPAFSGRWAQDYEAVPRLLRAVRRTQPATLAGVLLAQEGANRLVHAVVGKRLVPDGPSLLRQSERGPQPPVTDADRAVFDRFFGVTRADISYRTFAKQAAALTASVAQDIAERPLDDPATVHGITDAHAPTVARFLRAAPSILSEVLSLISSLEGQVA